MCTHSVHCPWCMQHTLCSTVHGACSTHSVPLSTVHATHTLFHCPRCMQHTLCSTVHGACSTHSVPLWCMQHTLCSTVHGACSTHSVPLSTVHAAHTLFHCPRCMQHTLCSTVHGACRTLESAEAMILFQKYDEMTELMQG